MTKETVTLEYPFTFDGAEVTELHLRRPKMRDMKRAQKHKDELEKTVAMIADLAEVSPKLIDELDTADFTELSKLVAGFMGVSEDQTP